MGAEIVDSLTHADAPLRFTIDLHMKLVFASTKHAGQIHAREQIRMTLKTPLGLIYNVACTLHDGELHGRFLDRIS
jgi:hypothetical protein